MLTDAEVICTFMEPRPSRLRGDSTGSGRYWRYASTTGDGQPVPMKLALNECHEVEARLTDEQWARYGNLFVGNCHIRCFGIDGIRNLLHASAEQKIRALATVLRPTLENANASL